MPTRERIFLIRYLTKPKEAYQTKSYHECTEGCSVHQRVIMSAQGDIQYTG